MKANINGIQLEGTPDEIIEYIRKMEMKQQTQPYPNPYAPYIDPYRLTAPAPPIKWNEITCGDIRTGSGATYSYNEWSDNQRKQPQ